MRVLLTGSNGFLGRNLVPELKKRYELVTFFSEDYDLRHEQDCHNLFDFAKPDVVIHAAGNVGGIGANQANPGAFMYDNLAMGMNVIQDACSMREDLQKFIMLGTVCAYPKHTPVPFKEEYIWDGYPEETNAPYGIAKKTLMKLVDVYHQQYDFPGVNLVPVNMYGPHDHFNTTSSHVIPAVITKIYRAITLKDSTISLWGTGQASREFLYAPDCADAIIKAIHADVTPEPINIGTGQEIKICELVELLADIMGYDGEFEYSTDMPDGQPRRCLDVSRAKERLGFEAKTSLRDGLKDTVDYFYHSLEKEEK